jgi:hypothetical protein
VVKPLQTVITAYALAAWSLAGMRACAVTGAVGAPSAWLSAAVITAKVVSSAVSGVIVPRLMMAVAAANARQQKTKNKKQKTKNKKTKRPQGHTVFWCVYFFSVAADRIELGVFFRRGMKFIGVCDWSVGDKLIKSEKFSALQDLEGVTTSDGDIVLSKLDVESSLEVQDHGMKPYRVMHAHAAVSPIRHVPTSSVKVHAYKFRLRMIELPMQRRAFDDTWTVDIHSFRKFPCPMLDTNYAMAAVSDSGLEMNFAGCKTIAPEAAANSSAFTIPDLTRLAALLPPSTLAAIRSKITQ